MAPSSPLPAHRSGRAIWRLTPCSRPPPRGRRRSSTPPPLPARSRDVVPGAIEAVLKQRGVTVEVVDLRPHSKKRFTSRRRRLRQPRPGRRQGLGGPGEGRQLPAGQGDRPVSTRSPTKPSLPDLPEGARVVSPYVAPAGDEGQAIRSAGARQHIGVRPPRLGHRQVAGGGHLADGRRHPGRGPGRPRGAERLVVRPGPALRDPPRYPLPHPGRRRLPGTVTGLRP